MRMAAIGLALGYATAAAAANDGGPLRDLGWGAVPADNGIAYLPFDIGGDLGDRARSAALQPDGKLLIGGSATTSSTSVDVAIARTLPSRGAPDPTFGSNGRVRLGPTEGGWINSMAAMSDGRIVYAAPLTGSTFVVGRLLADGTPDTSFDLDGRRVFSATAFVPQSSVVTYPALIVQPDGKIVLFLGAGRTSPDIEVYAATTRLDIDGATDTSFGGQGTGYATYAPAYGNAPQAHATTAVRMADGRFMVGGSGYRNGGSSLDMITFRLSANGVLDTAYGSNGFGVVALDQGGFLEDNLTDLAVDGAGRAVVIGGFRNINGQQRAAIARLTTSGQLDPTFGAAGRVLYEIRGTSQREQNRSVAVLPDGRILVVGSICWCPAGNGAIEFGTLTQFAPNGQINRFFGIDGTEHLGRQAGPLAQILKADRMVVSGDYAYVVGHTTSPTSNSNLEFASTRVIVPLFRGGFEAASPALP